MALHEIYTNAGLSLKEAQKMPDYLDWDDGFYDSDAYIKLFEYFAFETSEMPYGTAKARTGDPDVWILEYLEKLA
jgi:hypothetical protein